MPAGKISKTVLDFIKLYNKSFFGKEFLSRVNIITCDKGKLTGEFLVEKDMCNEYGALHGAFSCILLDNITTYALMSYQTPPLKGVTVSMFNQYFKPAKLGSKVLLDVKAIKVGKKLATLELNMIEKDTGILLTQGSHTKFVDI